MKYITLTLIALLSIASATAQRSQILTDSVDSQILHAKRAYSIYLPPGYDHTKQYPVLYLLHGKDGSNDNWTNSGKLKPVADRLIKSGEAKPMIIIMPDAGELDSPGKFGYFDIPGWDYERFFFDEFMPVVEGRHNAGGCKQLRAIAGLSMGGGGATAYALKHPEAFSSVYAMSALMDLPDGRKVFDDLYNRSVRDNSCIDFVTKADQRTLADLRSVHWYIDCGDEDFLFDRNIDFYRAMRAAKVPAELRIRDGAHDWEYWHTALYTCLPFVSQTF